MLQAFLKVIQENSNKNFVSSKADDKTLDCRKEPTLILKSNGETVRLDTRIGEFYFSSRCISFSCPYI